MKRKPWSGRFTENTDRTAEGFNASIAFDQRLFSHDIKGSIAHAMTLEKAGILTRKECASIIKGLKVVEKEIASGRSVFGPDVEDIHMAIEKRLTEKIGPVGGKLHTGRSRNDQVALDVRLYLKDEIQEILGLIRTLQKTLVDVAEKNLDIVMPGYTHLQRAQPVLLSHHLLAYFEMFERDKGRLLDCLKRMDVSPLGAGALAGSPYRLDRGYTAGLLGFAGATRNSLDSVSDRDFCIEFVSASAMAMMHLSRLSEELVLWSSSEFGFVELSDAFSTGSSLMPQKKNPDMAELARGKTGRVYGNLVALLTVMKALPLSYNKDMQEDKEPLFDTVDTVKNSLNIFSPMLRTLVFNKERMRDAARAGFLAATDAADYLVKKGMPFRKTHHIVGEVVAYCIKNKKTFDGLSLVEWKSFSPLFEKDIKKAISVESSLNVRSLQGGTSPLVVKKRLKGIGKEFERED
ncbi:MAG: argininosuccinate lyase [Deltaproteobacteria bacterium]|nr:argininosuccinate lyase [Deltaproteobacteria bacterium]